MKKYLSELFEERPRQWGLRGDPYFWNWLKEHFQDKTLPYDPEKLKKDVMNAYCQLTGYEMIAGERRYVEVFAAGGMSSGYIDCGWWLEKGIPLLMKRCQDSFTVLTNGKSAVLFDRKEDNTYLNPFYRINFEHEGITYQSAEQYMMAKKALLFQDIDRYQEIMNTEDPEKCMKLGRMIKNFDSLVWDQQKYEIAYNGNFEKFWNNDELREALLATGTAELIYAEQHDKSWGIGLGIHDPAAKDPDTWPGKNLLGQVLMNVRDELWFREQRLEITDPGVDAAIDGNGPERYYVSYEQKRAMNEYLKRMVGAKTWREDLFGIDE